MTAFVNPPFGNDATAQFDSRALPFRTQEAAHAAFAAWQKEQGRTQHFDFRIVETHQPLPKPPEPPDA